MDALGVEALLSDSSETTLRPGAGGGCRKPSEFGKVWLRGVMGSGSGK
jgi:hypothetical protein